MRLKYFFSVVSLFFIMNTNAQNFVVGTYNLRYENNFDTGNLWVDRAPVIEALIRFHDFDILGTQEGLIGMLNDLSKALPEYQRYGIGRDDGKDAGEHSAIFFKKDKFSLLKHGDFWLSQTPEKPSLGWDATCCNRICSWVYLQDKKSKKKFYVFNAHYDYQKDLARNESSKLILKEIKKIAGNEPVIFMGDLNGGNETQWYQAIANSGLLKDTFKEAKYPYANNPSFQDFGKEVDRTDVIDHIFVTKDFLVKRWGILSDTYHGKYPSDHFPVLAEVVLK
ncbi:MAG: endonuclease/exonuclease/phosphatase family protein [Ginsengibacter sp.]